MADSKYGRIFTEDDVRSLMLQAAGLGASCVMSKSGAEEIVMPTEEISQGVENVLSDYDGKFGKTEPVFVVRAQDNFAVATVRAYGELCQGGNAGALEVVAGGLHQANVQKAVDDFLDWQTTNPDLVKIPD